MLGRPQHTITSPDPEYALKAIEGTRDGLEPGDHFYYADEFNLSWMPTLKAMWGPKGQQEVMIRTPAQPTRRYGIGAVDYRTGETVVLIRGRKRRPEIAELLESLCWRSTPRVASTWPGITRTPTRTTRSKRWCEPRRAAWSCSTAYLQSLVEPHRDALAPLAWGGGPLRTVSERQGADRSGPRLLRAL